MWALLALWMLSLASAFAVSAQATNQAPNRSSNQAADGVQATSPSTSHAACAPKVTVVGYGDLEDAAEVLQPDAEALAAKAHGLLAAPDCRPIVVELVRNLKTPGEHVPKWRLPTWAAGAARPTQRRITVTNANPSKAARMQVLLHEMVHVAVRSAAGDAEVPLWFNEGVSRHLAGEVGNDTDEQALARAYAKRRIPPLGTLRHRFPSHGPDAQVAYAVSGRAVSMLQAGYGPDIFGRILGEARRGRPFLDALYEQTGETEAGLTTRIEQQQSRAEGVLNLLQPLDFGMALAGLLAALGGLKARMLLREKLPVPEFAPRPMDVTMVKWTVYPR